MRRAAPMRRRARKAQTRAERAHLALVASKPCLICGAWPVHVHHLRHDPATGAPLGMSQRAPHAHTIPLCPRHHQDGPKGVAFHAGPQTFEATHGREVDLWRRFMNTLKEAKHA